MKKNKARGNTQAAKPGQVPRNDQTADPQGSKSTSSPKLKWLLVLSIFAASLLLYGNTFTHQFTLDDPGIVNNNRITKAPVSLENIKVIFSTPLRRGQMDIENSLYRPFTKLFFNLEWNLFGGSATAFHIVNVVLYGILGALIYLVLYDALNRKWVLPYIIALLFIFHPIHTEVVANVKNGEEILSMIGIMGAMRCIQLYFSTKKKWWLAGGAGLFLMALFSKESSVVAAGLFPLFIYYFIATDKKHILKVSGVMLFCALAFLFCRWRVLDGLPQLRVNPLDNLLVLCQDGAERFATATGLMGVYLFKFVAPHPLSCDYSFSSFEPINFGSPMFLVSALVFTGLFVYAIKGFRTKGLVSFGIGWFFIGMAISSNIFILIGTSFAERLLFLPSLGLCISVVGLAAKLVGRVQEAPSLIESFKSSPRLWMVFVPVFALFGFKTIDRNAVWANDVELFATDVKNYPNSVHLLFYMGNHQWGMEPQEVVDEQIEQLGYSPDQVTDSAQKEGMLVIHYLSRAYNIYPELPAESYYYLGKAYNAKRQFDSALFFLRKSLTRYSTVTTEAYYQIGLVYKSTEQLDSAWRYLSLAYEGDPKNPAYMNNLGILYCTLNKPADALPLFKGAHAINPKATDFMNNLGAVYGNLGQPDSAIWWFERVLDVEPSNTVALNFLDFTWRNKGEVMKADEYKRRAEASGTRKGVAGF